ncbi:MAG: AAA family ATPase [Bryobacteraceae bacterium]|nr:AAA family ATPase [Bryobacteraceae bacterium]
MNSAVTLSQNQLLDFLLHVAPVRPVFVWGPPGVGKSALVQRFAHEVGLDCVSLLGSQLAPEDLIGVPQITNGVSRFCPPSMIAREKPYCLFLDELNACSPEVQKAFYSLIHERRIGEFVLPPGSVVIGAGNRAQDAAIVKPMSSALINRMIHVHLKVSHRDWLAWAEESEVHPLVLDYIRTRPDHLWQQPPKHEETFSSPRSWHMLSDVLKEYAEPHADETIAALAFGCVSPEHAGQFKTFVRHLRSRFQLDGIMKGDLRWPSDAGDRDILYFLAQSFRAHLSKNLPLRREEIAAHHRELAHTGKGLLKELATISLELAQLVVAEEGDQALPNWFLVEVVRDLPRLVVKKPDGKN